jgi:cardiolipin synthase
VLEANTFKKEISRKLFFFLSVSGFSFFYAWVVFAATHAKLPCQEHPIRLYSNQTRQDIKLLFLQAFSRANQSIFLSMYGITDMQVLNAMSKKSFESIPISVKYDPSASAPLKKLLPSSINIHPIKTAGLMHRKILLIDKAQVFLGTANLTPTSLRHHANLIIGIYHPGLAAFLENPNATAYSFEIQQQQGELFLFPDSHQRGFARLIQCIDSSKIKITIAMFTLTHPEIGEALIRAKRRGVDVSIAIDAYTARGASKKMVHTLEEGGIHFFLSQGKELLHHKWAVIDEQFLILGSANWTKAAFSKNHDLLLFLSPLEKKQIDFLNHLWNIIEAESSN